MDQISVTKDQFMTALRYLIASGGSWAVGKGYINSDTLSAIIEVAAVLGPLAWGLYASSRNSQQAKAVGVQAALNMATMGQALDKEGHAIAPLPQVPKPVTIASATQIVNDFGPKPSTIAKA